MKATTILLMAVLIAALLIIGGIAVAQDEGGPVFTGCLKESGTLYRVAIGERPKKNCVGTDTVISWSHTGPSGNPGAPGSDGTAGTDAVAPAGAVMYFDLANCPNGWSELVEARGRTVVGLPPVEGSAPGTLKGTVGLALSDMENRGHTHALDSEKAVTSKTRLGVTVSAPFGTSSIKSGLTGADYSFSHHDHGHSASLTQPEHTHTVQFDSLSSGSKSTGDVMPYIQLMVCRKD